MFSSQSYERTEDRYNYRVPRTQIDRGPSSSVSKKPFLAFFVLHTGFGAVPLCGLAHLQWLSLGSRVVQCGCSVGLARLTALGQLVNPCILVQINVSVFIFRTC
ncbi:hypothetical protein V8F06_000275 [Rhypophila decipiens]